MAYWILVTYDKYLFVFIYSFMYLFISPSLSSTYIYIYAYIYILALIGIVSIGSVVLSCVLSIGPALESMEFGNDNRRCDATMVCHTMALRTPSMNPLVHFFQFRNLKPQ